MPGSTPHSPELPPAASRGRRGDVARGSWLVVALLLLGVSAAVVGIWFQRQQTRRCLEFYGLAAARRITSGASVELLVVRPGSGPRSLAAVSSLDVSDAPGLVHLRRGLVEDANFSWNGGDGPTGGAAGRGAAAPRPRDAWDVALVFRDRAGLEETAVVLDFDGDGGALAVVGRQGWIGLGRIGPGLETWIRDSVRRAGRDGEAAQARPAAAGESR